MPFTDKCDIYCALHENAINKLVTRAMRFFPSFFNYGSAYVCSHARLLCSPITADPDVSRSGDPLMTSVPVTLPPTLNLPMGIQPVIPDFCVQLTVLDIDFFPGNAIDTPASFPALSAQQLGLKATVQIGLSCPNCPKEAEVLNCFSLDILAEMTLHGQPSGQWLTPRLTAFDVRGIAPDGLKAFIDCYAIFIANQALDYIGKKVVGLVAAPLSLPNLYGTVSLAVKPSSVAPNPAIENDQIKLFADIATLTLNEVVGPSGSATPGSKLPPAISRAPRTRPSSGPADLTVALSQSTFAKMFGAMLGGGIKLDLPMPPETGQIGNTGDFAYLNYTVSASLQSGTIALQNNGTVLIHDLVISWDTLKFTVNFNLPTVGPFDFVVTKVGPFFDSDSDITIPIDLSNTLTTKVSAVVLPSALYGQGDPHTPNCPNRWQIFLAPQLPLFVMPIELNQKFTDAILDGIKKAFNDIGIPSEITGLVVDALKLADSTFQGFDKIAETLLDALVNGIGSEVGLTQKLDAMLYDYFASKAPLLELPDPFTVSIADKNTHKPATTLPIPIAYLGVRINAQEMVIEGDVGA